MRNLKRALSLGMTAAMISGLVVTTGAVSYPDVSSSDNLEAIEVLQAVGVMKGDENGKFNPDQNVTRAEMATIMANMLGLRVEDFENAAIPFTDVPEWAHKYVAACYAAGITAGTSATTYGSNASVTTAQAALMMMKALGYFQYSGDFGSDWQLATVKQASDIDLFDGIGANATAALTRNEVAQLALNTLEATMVQATGSEGIIIGDVTVGSTIKYEEVTKADSKGEKYNKIDDAKDGDKYYVQLGEELFSGDLKKETATDDFNREGTKWTYTDSKGVTTESSVYVDAADYTQVVSDSDDKLADVAEDASKKLELASDAKVYLNAGNGSAGMALQVGDVVEFRDVKDNKAASVNVIRYDVGVIDEVDTDVKKADADDGVSAYISIKNGPSNINNTDIAGYNEDTYVEDAVIGYIQVGDEIVASYIASSVKGSITAYSSDTYTMGGTKYTLAGNVDDEIAQDVDFKDGSYKLYLDPNGYVVKTEVLEGSVSLNDVFYLNTLDNDKIYWTKDEESKGKTTTTYYVQAVYMDGTVKDIQIAEASGDTNISAVETYLGKLSADALYTTTKSEANDDVDVSLTAWDYAEDDYYVTAANGTIKTADDKKLSNGDYINSDTKYVVVESYNDDVKVTVKTGTLSYEYATGDSVTSIAKKVDGAKVAQYVIINTKSFTAAETGDYIYIVDKDTYVNVADGKQYTVYNKDGKEVNVIVDKDVKISSNGLYTYSVDEDGVYTDLKNTSANFKSGEFVSYYGNLLTVKGLKADLDASDAVIVDAHDTDDDAQYGKSVTSLSAMYNAVKNGEYTVNLDLVVNSDDEVEYIVVTSVMAK